MKLLLDENLPKKLKLDFPKHDIYTVSDKKWNSKRNGELLQLILEEAATAPASTIIQKTVPPIPPSARHRTKKQHNEAPCLPPPC